MNKTMTNLSKFLACSIIFLNSHIYGSQNTVKDFSDEDKKGFLHKSNTYLNEGSCPHILNIKTQIKKAHDKADYKILIQAHDEFSQLNHSEEEWNDIAKGLKAYKWPNQYGKQVVAGHLFYPDNVNDLLDSPATEYLLRKIDMIWAFAISAKYEHPLGQYYLALTLDEIQDNYYDQDKPQFLQNLYKKSLNVLSNNQCQNNPDACYILGLSHTSYSGKVGGFNFNSQKALQFHEKGGDYKNRLKALETKRKYKRIFQSPSINEYINLGEEGYGPAYVEATKLEKDFERKIVYLDKAVTLNYFKALITKGSLYEEKRNPTEAFELYKKAAEKGISKGYLNMGRMRLHGISLEQAAEIEDNSQTIQEAMQYFADAGKENDPEGWDQLLTLYQKLYYLTQDKNYISDIKNILDKGLKLGSSKAYHKAENIFQGNFQKVIEKYGFPPQSNLFYQDIITTLKWDY